jgi:hypothetical protein
MHTRRLQSGIARGLILAALVIGGVAFLQARSINAAPAGLSNYVPANPKLQVSSIRQALQYFLVDHAKQTAAIRAAVAKQQAARGNSATYVGCTPLVPFNAPGGANMWNKDPCNMLQSEESIALNTSNSELVGGVNDFGGFFGLNSDNPFSITGYTVAGAAAGSVIRNWGDLPGVTDPGCTDGSILVSRGDPYVGIAKSDGTAYMTSLATPGPGTCGNNNGDNGIEVNVGNGSLYTSGACTDGVLTSTCWTPHLIHQANISGCATNTLPCQMDDKDSLAVDNTPNSPGYGNVYVAFDIIDHCNAPCVLSNETGVVVGCDHTVTSCSSAVTYSGASLNEFSPFVAVRSDGSLEIGYESFDTTPNSTDLNLTHCTVSGHTPTCLAPTKFDSINSTVVCGTPPSPCDATNDQLLTGLATNGLRILTQVKIAIDDTTGTNAGHTYAVWDQCATNEDQFGSFNNLTGACGASNIEMDDIATPTSTGTRVGYPGGRYDDFMPTVAVDQTNGHVWVAYYSTKTDLSTFGATPTLSFDVGNHSGIRPFVTTSAGGTGLLQAPFGITTANDSYQADSCVQVFGCVPQFGDYFQIVADSGHAYIHFNVNFEQKGGPATVWFVTGVVNQEDNYMCRFLTYPPSNTQRPCSS